MLALLGSAQTGGAEALLYDAGGENAPGVVTTGCGQSCHVQLHQTLRMTVQKYQPGSLTQLSPVFSQMT